MGIDFSKVVPMDRVAEGSGSGHEVVGMFDEASNYLRSFDWCLGIKEAFLGIGIPGVVAVFLVRIVPAGPNIDEWLWTVVGDVPPAYLVTEQAPNPASALDAYIGEMQEWVKAAKSGRSVDELIPVNVLPNAENAAALERRLELLDRMVLSQYPEDLASAP